MERLQVGAVGMGLGGAAGVQGAALVPVALTPADHGRWLEYRIAGVPAAANPYALDLLAVEAQSKGLAEDGDGAWRLVGTVGEGAGPRWTFGDDSAVVLTRRFYRALAVREAP